MSMIIFRQEGTTCVVLCPVESDNRFIPAIEQSQPGVQGSLLQFASDSPVFDTQGEAWAHHAKVMQELITSQHQAIDSRFEAALHVLKKKAGRGLAPSLALVQSDE